ncbi:MAG: chemotaxis protein CheX [Planctomycetaceae bacterium]|nr:chemotaxis protein CheX [Planctomycetaceae bacterium]
MQPCRETLARIAEDTFASLAFMFPVEPQEAPPSAAPPVIASVAFHGPWRGWLEMSLPPEMMAPLAANILGADDPADTDVEKQVDALKEVLNVICGNLLPVIDSPQSEYTVAAPLMQKADLAGPDAAATETSICLDSGTVQLRLLLAAA